MTSKTMFIYRGILDNGNWKKLFTTTSRQHLLKWQSKFKIQEAIWSAACKDNRERTLHRQGSQCRETDEAEPKPNSWQLLHWTFWLQGKQPNPKNQKKTEQCKFSFSVLFQKPTSTILMVLLKKEWVVLKLWNPQHFSPAWRICYLLKSFLRHRNMRPF